ncbi:dao-2 [Pristionchus pacificus]|uniref:Dao-2 n=1 Tax=Pristionchus pacificus TaxID=54126 RepID=A0A454XTJ5_PRIPA|nr:dao-2 [Pristionchus pacificus]|eukprot:PDM78148.1 dao-2 [Pristionchus pacificus]
MILPIILLSILSSVNAHTPNDKLKNCCSTIKRGDKDCIDRFCDFNSISQTNILNYLSTCSDKGPTVGMMWDCASLRHDHTECCKAKGVEGKCLEYCAAHDGVPTNYLDYLFCTESFNEIRDCFHDHMDKNEAYSHKH